MNVDLSKKTIEELVRITGALPDMELKERIATQTALLEEAYRRDKAATTTGVIETHVFGAEIHLGALFPGSIFATRDGIWAVKSEYHYPSGVCQCVLLASGEYAHFDAGNDTLVRPLHIQYDVKRDLPAPAEFTVSRAEAITEATVAPEWMQAYLKKLIVVTGYQGEVMIVTIPRAQWPSRVGVTDAPDAFVRIALTGPDIIFLPDDAEEDDRNKSVIAHEFVHVLYGRVDKFVRDRLQTEEELVQYMQLVEKASESLAVLLIVGGLMNVRFERYPEKEAV